MKNSDKKIEKICKPGDYIGDWSLNSFFFPSCLQASGKEEVTVLVISNRKLRGILGDNLYSLNWKNLSRLAFSQSKFFSCLPAETIEKLIENLEISCYEKNQVIIQKGCQMESLFIPLDGSVRKSSSIEISNKYEENAEEIFDECALLGENYLMGQTSLKRDESIVMENKGVLGEISRTSIERIIGKKLNELIENSNQLGSSLPSTKSDISIENPPDNKQSINKNDIEVLKMVGDGQFGLVFLVRMNNKHFALKVCVKSYIISRRFELYLINEKKIQTCLEDFPFLIKLHQSFKDENLVYFLMDYVNGKDLATIFYDGNQTFSCNIVKFYIAQLILTIEYLHSKKIIHRDIKLNNILVDQHGYIKLIDFGIAKQLMNGQNKTFTIVGTPHYMAPEIILGKGYDYSVDFWAIGVCLFEMLFGILPFGNNTEDPLEVYGNIISSKLPAIGKKQMMNLSNGTVNFINKMLCKDVTKRYSMKDFKEIKEHQWFQSLDWNALFEKKITPPHPQKEEKIANLKGKQLNEYLQMEEMRSFLKKEERKFSKIQNWDEFF